MTQSALSALTLGYRPLWSRTRRLAGVQLHLHEEPGAPADMQHLLRILQELWSDQAPPLLLSPRSRQALSELLAHAPQGSPWIEVRGDWLLQDAGIWELARQARARGLMLVWGGSLADVPDPDTARLFASSLLSLPAQGAEGVPNLPSAQLARQDPARLPTHPLQLLDGQMYEGLQSLALARICLDGHAAGAVAGWPVADTVQALRLRQPQPARDSVLGLMQAIDKEQSLDTLEHLLAEDPVLAYRFMLHTNSAALGLRRGVDSLRRGLVMLGLGTLQRWLADQLPHACTEPDLVPLRTQMVLRARLAEHLIEAGVGLELQREMYLCALFSQLDLLLHEPLNTTLRRMPLSDRIFDAVLARTGPYAGSLAMAMALESPDAAAIRQLREEHEWETEDLNRILLRMLCGLRLGMPMPGRPT
jgi:hypothetical protein